MLFHSAFVFLYTRNSNLFWAQIKRKDREKKKEEEAEEEEEEEEEDEEEGKLMQTNFTFCFSVF